MTRFKWQINVRLSIFTLLFLPLLTTLGFWQLHRADEKQTILENHSAQQALPTLALSSNTVEYLSKFRRVSASGEFVVDRYWLLEGRIRHGVPGYEIMVAFAPDETSDKLLLVNRGWVEAAQDRTVLPDIVHPHGEVWLEGYVLAPYDSPLIDERKNTLFSWPHRILEVDFDIMRDQIGEDLYPFVLQLAEDDPLAFDVMYVPTNMPPAKHRGYAMQWFAMAFALMLLWLFANSNLWLLIKHKLQ